ncbi:uncharacterized protein LOC126941871 [Macaca thibetana thibetana]|uniref:uncharacterized protein LOC126941871 n=1 Tax=Macaca thibetana thibetana TaxID=257877 RepID=UPI0021BC6F31|nr:uncharacterized protein LOC126941871 [Macaca thibetana thibetana]
MLGLWAGSLAGEALPGRRDLGTIPIPTSRRRGAHRSRRSPSPCTHSGAEAATPGLLAGTRSCVPGCPGCGYPLEPPAPHYSAVAWRLRVITPLRQGGRRTLRCTCAPTAAQSLRMRMLPPPPSPRKPRDVVLHRFLPQVALAATMAPSSGSSFRSQFSFGLAEPRFGVS